MPNEAFPAFRYSKSGNNSRDFDFSMSGE